MKYAILIPVHNLGKVCEFMFTIDRLYSFKIRKAIDRDHFVLKYEVADTVESNAINSQLIEITNGTMQII